MTKPKPFKIGKHTYGKIITVQSSGRNLIGVCDGIMQPHQAERLGHWLQGAACWCAAQNRINEERQKALEAFEAYERK